MSIDRRDSDSAPPCAASQHRQCRERNQADGCRLRYAIGSTRKIGGYLRGALRIVVDSEFINAAAGGIVRQEWRAAKVAVGERVRAQRIGWNRLLEPAHTSLTDVKKVKAKRSGGA